MAGIMVSAATGVMNSLLTKLTALLGEEYKLLRNVKRDIISLQSELSSINALLEKLADMEVLDPQTTEWRNQVREMAYDIEDCIDDYMYRLKHEPDKPGSIKGFFRKHIRKIKKLGARHEIAEQIQELKVQIIEANQRRERYKLDAAVSSISCSTNVPIDPRLMALYAEAADLVGIDGPRDELAKLVSNEEQQLKVVSIVGFGGLGKTTLANQVYQQVKEQFHCSAFVSVSQKPDIKKVLRTILSEIKRQECVKEEAWDEKQLINSIRELLMDKRYFIVIDDIWSVEAWEPIKCALFDNNCGSRIMTTTRNVTVAESCCSLQGHVYDLKPLEEADSQSLFFKRIFGYIDGCPPHLKEISTEIMKKCCGLPLAIITMSSLLSSKSYTKEAWEGVRNSISSGFEKNYDMKKMNMILSLSYNDLPRYLKTCLLYLSIFPEDYTIERARLIRRWMAEGFIEIVRGRTIEEEAECYFNELINRSMIQPTDIDHFGQAPACRVHDMIRDLIISKAVKENFVTFISDQEHGLVAKDKVRRLSLDYRDKKCAIILSTDVSHVRSLSVFGGNSEQIPPLLDFRALRVFDVVGIDQLKNHHLKNIGELVQLRYIRIRTYEVTELPEQIGELQYLETLDLINTRIRGLPASIVKLQRLKHLLVDRVKLPKGIGNMHALEELLYVYIGESCSMTCLQELGNLTKLRVLKLRFRIIGSDDEKRRYADNLVLSLSKLGSFNLRRLSLHANFEISFDSWSPHPHLLWRLRIYTFYLCKIPEWISSLTNLRHLDIKVNILGRECFHILGDLPSLAYLFLSSDVVAPEERLIIIGSRRFPCLKSFHLYCSNFGFLVMFEAGAMPKLEDVYFQLVKAQGAISACGNAPDLGIHHLSALTHLRVEIDCKDARFEEVKALEAAIRNATSLLPKQPKLILYRYYEEEMVMNDGERKSSEGDAQHGESGHELEDEKSQLHLN